MRIIGKTFVMSAFHYMLNGESMKAFFNTPSNEKFKTVTFNDMLNYKLGIGKQ